MIRFYKFLSKIGAIKQTVTEIEMHMRRPTNEINESSRIIDNYEKKDMLIPQIRIVGIGDAGCYSVRPIASIDIPGIRVLEINTDIRTLDTSPSKNKIIAGQNITDGYGTHNNPTIGFEAVREVSGEIEQFLKGSNIVFIVAGMGGGTGTGGISVVADISRKLNILTIAAISKPFSSEGMQRKKIAEQGISVLKDKVDAIIIIPNDRLLRLVNPAATIQVAFKLSTQVLTRGIRAISDLITIPSMLQIDIADVNTIMRGAGYTYIGIGEGKGDNRAEDAARQAINSPLLDYAIKKARGLLINISGDHSMALKEVNAAAEIVVDIADENANIIFGCTIDESLEGMIKVTLIATGIGDEIMTTSDEYNGTKRKVISSDY